MFKWRRGRDSYMFHLAWSSQVERTPEGVFVMLDALCDRSQRAETMRNEMIRQGHILLAFVENEAERVVHDSKVVVASLEPGRPQCIILVSNYGSSLMHDVAYELVQKSYDLVIFWRRSSKTRMYHSTLVSSEGRGIDVSSLSSAIAAVAGGTGGGHEHCAGMQTIVNPEVLLHRYLASK